jgi:D-lactate dehydrogenase (quinone)
VESLAAATCGTTGPASREDLIGALRKIVGASHVLLGQAAAERYTRGYRYGHGEVVAVVRPGSLVEQWRVLKACVPAGAVVIFQAANTGLTAGSTPFGDYDRPVVLVNTLRIDAIHLVDGARQVVCLPGATLYALERKLKPLGREPHSVIGSSCIGASAVGGVCNNSGGSLVHRGPVYTELSLFAQVDEAGRVGLVNHLGIELGADPETVLQRIERGEFSDLDVDLKSGRIASDDRYAAHVRDVDAPTPARFNADPSRLYEVSGCAGKLAVFAVRLDTFPAERGAVVFYIGTNDAGELTRLRRDMLGKLETLPLAGEYMHRTAYDVAEAYGKDTFLAIQWLGTGRLPGLFALKAMIDAAAKKLGFRSGFVDRLLQRVSRFAPGHLPRRMRDFRARYEHYLMIKTSAAGAGEARSYLTTRFPSRAGDFFECTPDEGAKAFLHRFAAAGAAVRYREVHREAVEDILALDIALRRNDSDWFERLPPNIEQDVIHKLYYGHFFCHVFHQDYIVRKGVDPIALERRMLDLLEQRGAEYPAEHNVGHLYKAKPALSDFYKSLDPRNVLNPGIGRTSRSECWR